MIAYEIVSGDFRMTGAIEPPDIDPDDLAETIEDDAAAEGIEPNLFACDLLAQIAEEMPGDPETEEALRDAVAFLADLEVPRGTSAFVRVECRFVANGTDQDRVLEWSVTERVRPALAVV